MKLSKELRVCSKTKRLRLKQCRRCNDLFQGTKFAKYCKECNGK